MHWSAKVQHTPEYIHSNVHLLCRTGHIWILAGILDKSNQNYKTLLRSHTDEILAMDFHVQKQHIITVSKDKTIRLWDI